MSANCAGLQSASAPSVPSAGLSRTARIEGFRRAGLDWETAPSPSGLVPLLRRFVYNILPLYQLLLPPRSHGDSMLAGCVLAKSELDGIAPTPLPGQRSMEGDKRLRPMVARSIRLVTELESWY